MITGLTIKDFRGIGWGRLDNLTPLVILVGPNGCGKSTVLDALLLGASKDPQNQINVVLDRQEPIVRTNAQGQVRSGSQTNKSWLFHKGSSKFSVIQVATESRIPEGTSLLSAVSGRAVEPDRSVMVRTTQLKPPNSREGNVVISFSNMAPLRDRSVALADTISNGAFQPFPDISDIRLVDTAPQYRLETIEDLYSQATRQGLNKDIKTQALELLKNAENIEILTEGNQPVLHITYPNYSVPVVLAGEGIKLYLRQSLELAAPPNTTILMEEPEAHLNIRTMKFSAKALFAATHRKIQIILTTHSLEFIDEIISAATPEDLSNISLFRLKLNDGNLVTSHFSGTQTATARELLQEDLR